MALDVSQVIDGKYKVLRLIGEGGMGTVYEGENSRIGRRVAIKVLHAQVAAMPEFVERFEREARAAARVGSPHVCDVLDLGDLPGGDRYIVMEYLSGISLEERIAKGPMTPERLAPIAFELLEGLATMHAARVIHRDLKPANVFLAKTGTGRGEIVKILDFGVAKLLPFEGEVGTMTQTGSMMGTPLYMSPEQARGARDVDGRTDIYAASVMFYRALAGTLPYTADTLNELLFKIVLEDPKPLRELVPNVDEGFAALVHRGLARDIEQRFATAREYQSAIADWGRKQGRTSLQFAVTMPSEPPGASTSSDPPVRSYRLSDSAANSGTPTAWSEDRPQPEEASGTVGSSTKISERDPASASSPKIEVADSARPVSAHEIAPTLAASGSAPALPAAVAAQATTSPSAGELERAGKARRRMVLGLGAGAAALVGALVFFGSAGGGGGGTGATTTAETSDETTTATATVETEVLPLPGATAATAATTETLPDERAAAAGADAGVEHAHDTPPATTAATNATAKAPSVSNSPRAAVPTTGTGTTAPATRTTATDAAPASAAPVAVTATSPTTTPKPASSAGRKFRTNLD